jgi:CpXC protein
MSIFRTVEVSCPACDAAVTFNLVHSVNADRRPDLRDAILKRSFQRQPCPSCDYEFRVEPEFSYMDMRRGQFFAVWPSERVEDFEAYEERSRKSFEHAYGAGAPPEAQNIGRSLTPRVVFGWIAFNEKLIAQQAGLDDVLLELVKLALIRTDADGPGLGVGTELRLIGVEEDKLVLGWFQRGKEELLDVVTVSKDLLSDIESKPDQWKDLRQELTSSYFVDYRRFFIAVA